MSKTMVYQRGGNMRIDRNLYGKYKVVADEDLDAALADGWFKTPAEAFAEKKEPSMLDQLRAKADELGMTYNKKTSAASLQSAIAKKLGEQ